VWWHSVMLTNKFGCHLTNIQITYLNINHLDTLNFIMSLFHASTCFEHYVLIIRRSNLYYTASDDEHMVLETCRGMK